MIDRLPRGKVGTFVDIGSCYPVLGSNTRSFYAGARPLDGERIVPSRALVPEWTRKEPRTMKRMIKSIARAGWAGIGPVRRPLVRKFHLLMNDRQRSVVDEVDQRVAQHLGTIEPFVQELNLVLDSMVHELTRLQAQVEVLYQKIEEQSTGAPVVRFGTIDEADDCDPYAAGSDHSVA
ncbi:MAG TPA: hypothetical protein VKP69_17530 [Isosphaeraceae bacterium]|nr:hypothetical protein [Isosphaeraceae bacterium]